MSKNNFSDLGRQLQQIVQDALRTQDFTKLKNTIHTTVDTTVKKVKEETGFFTPPAQGTVGRKRNEPSYHDVPRRQREKIRVPGMASGVCMEIFGGIFGGIFTLSFILSLAGSIAARMLIPATVVLGMFMAAGWILMGIGVYRVYLSKRFQRHLKQLAGVSFCPIQQLAESSDVSCDAVVKDLKKMVKKGILREIYFDEKQTCVMMDKETYHQYQLAEKEWKQQKAEEEKRAQDPEFAALQKVIAEGREYIRQIREANDALPGEEISQKLFRLEESAAKVFDYVEDHPVKLSELNNFIGYYLPTTIKLVRAYQEFEEDEVKSDKVLEAKRDILNILDTIPVAFDNLLTSLYQDTILDITSDISTLETVMLQDGLTGGDFSGKKRKKKESQQ